MDNAPSHRPIILNSAIRWSCATIGLFELSIGGWATIASDNQMGTVAFVLTGALFVLFSLTGRVPYQISKDGLNFEPLVNQKAIEALADNGSTETKEDLAKAIDEARNEVTDLIVPRNPAVSELALEKQLRSAFLKAGFKLAEDTRRGGPDIVIEEGTRRVGIELKTRTSLPLPRPAFHQLKNMIDNDCDSIILITSPTRGSTNIPKDLQNYFSDNRIKLHQIQDTEGCISERDMRLILDSVDHSLKLD